MKQAHWVGALVVLAGMVFVVTFAMNYLGTGHSTRDRPPPLERRLTFAYTAAPSAPTPPEREDRALQPTLDDMALDCEYQRPSHFDYWFANPNDEPVTVGMLRKSCRCASVKLFVLPGEGAHELAASAAGLVGLSPGAAGALRAVAGYEWALGKACSGAEPHELLRQGASVRVLPHAAGWVRLSWERQETGLLQLEADLTMRGGKDTATAEQRLVARVHFHRPLRASRKLSAGALDADKLPHTLWLTVWSSTRSQLRFRAEAVSLRAGSGADPFEVGRPVRLTEEERVRLERAHNPGVSEAPPPGAEDSVGRVRCAYRVPVTLRAVAADGKTPFDLGRFQRWVKLSGDDVPEPEFVEVTGQVRGLVSVGTAEEAGGVDLGHFPRSRGKREPVHLLADVDGLKLTVDQKRTSPFLRAELKPDKDDPAGQSWSLVIRVLPDKVRGKFPRREEPYHDSAVYLRAEEPGKKVRAVRIGVFGTAEEG
jgi:hypothetical protein